MPRPKKQQTPQGSGPLDSFVEREVVPKKHVNQFEKATVAINSSCTVVVVVVVVILILVVFVDCFFIVCIRIFKLL